MRTMLNGQVLPDTNGNLLDRGLQYGDGVFRTLAINAGEVLDLAAQIQHLLHDAGKLGIHCAAGLLQDEAMQLAQTEQQAVLKIIITRGYGGRGYPAAGDLSPNRYLYLSPPPPVLGQRQEQGIAVHSCATRLALNERLAGIKHLNRLEQVLARQEWNDDGIAEGLVYDTREHLIGGVQSNLFLVRDGQLLTPDLRLCGVAGRMRERVMLLAAEQGMACRQAQLQQNDLEQAQEVFLTNSLIGIWPVTQCGHQAWACGPLTRQLQTLLQHPALS